jgi:hypothetical protein
MKSRKELAEAMRKRQKKLLPTTGPELGVTRKKIESMSDDEIIKSYITCSQCGGKMATIGEVDMVLAEDPATFDDFWEMLEMLVKAIDIARAPIRHHQSGKERTHLR